MYTTAATGVLPVRIWACYEYKHGPTVVDVNFFMRWTVSKFSQKFLIAAMLVEKLSTIKIYKHHHLWKFPKQRNIGMECR